MHHCRASRQRLDARGIFSQRIEIAYTACFTSKDREQNDKRMEKWETRCRYRNIWGRGCAPTIQKELHWLVSSFMKFYEVWEFCVAIIIMSSTTYSFSWSSIAASTGGRSSFGDTHRRRPCALTNNVTRKPQPQSPLKEKNHHQNHQHHHHITLHHSKWKGVQKLERENSNFSLLELFPFSRAKKLTITLSLNKISIELLGVHLLRNIDVNT